MNNSPKKLALICSIIITYLVVTIYALAFHFIYDKIYWVPFFLIALSLFLITYFVFKYTIENFIYDKIKLIYKTIHNYKVAKGKKQSKISVDFNKDVLSDVNEEVSNWAQESTDEIAHLKKMEQYRKDFLGNVSHELKTPIFSIQGYISTLLDGGLEDANVNRLFLERAEKNIDRLTNIINDLEAISRLESGELKLEFSTFNIAALTDEVFETLERKTFSKKISLQFKKDYSFPVNIYGDKEKIRQVLTNLIQNSITYGILNGSTKVSFFDMDENILIEISDNGIGISSEDLPRIFERFYRCDKSHSRENEGTGLGLSIVKHIIEAHEQTINVRSTPGVGTTFAFTLKKA